MSHRTKIKDDNLSSDQKYKIAQSILSNSIISYILNLISKSVFNMFFIVFLVPLVNLKVKALDNSQIDEDIGQQPDA